MYVGGPVRPTIKDLQFYKYEMFCEDLPEELPDVKILIHNLVQRTLDISSDPIQREMGMATRFLPGVSEWQTTAHRHEFDSVRGQETNASTLLFPSGSMSITGSMSSLTDLLVIGLILDELSYRSGARWDCVWNDQVVMTDLIVCEVVLPFQVSLEKVAKCPLAKWRPELFPGVFICVIPRNPVNKNSSVLVFKGRFLVAGPKTAEHAHALCALMLFFLERFKGDDAPDAPPPTTETRPSKRRRMAKT